MVRCGKCLKHQQEPQYLTHIMVVIHFRHLMGDQKIRITDDVVEKLKDPVSLKIFVMRVCFSLLGGFAPFSGLCNGDLVLHLLTRM